MINEQPQSVPQTIFSYIEEEEINFNQPIKILDWEWGFKEHIKKSFFYKHGRLMNGNSDEIPVKNIVKPILNLQYWAEDIDVKEITLFIENQDQHHLSFLVKKYHDDVFLQENNLDSLWDECNQSRIDYGLGLLMNMGKARPERVNIESISFCNQSDIINSPIGFKYFYSAGEIKDMEKKGWGLEANGADITIDELIILSRSQGEESEQPSKIAGKYITVDMVIGEMPNTFLNGEDSEGTTYQIQIVAYYNNKNNEKQGVTLFKKKTKNPFKQIKRDEVFGRAAGFGGAEELFEAQAWTTYNEIKMKDVMDAAAKIIHITDDELFFARNRNLKKVENNQVLNLQDGKTIRQMDTYPRSIILFEKSINEWDEYAKRAGGAPTPLSGESPSAGTPFKLQELVTQTGKNPHDFRRGQYAKFIEDVYRDWIIPHIVKEITKGKTFLSTLSLEEMQNISEKVVKNQVNRKVIDRVLEGKLTTKEQQELWKQEFTEEFMKDNNKFLKIIKDELKDAKVNIKINVAGKQKNLSAMTDKLVNIFKQIMSSVNPQTGQSVLDDPKMAKIFNQILEYSGLSEIDFASYKTNQNNNQAPAVPQPVPAPAI